MEFINNFDPEKHKREIDKIKLDELKKIVPNPLLNEELKSLVWEVLSPLEANMIVTVKEIDFIIDKLSKLISNGINKAIHNID